MNVLLGRDFLTKLQAAGVLPPHTRRVVIDAAYDEVVQVYYECFGDSRMLSIDTAETFHDMLAVHVEDLAEK
jgi:hypothetical protein